MSLLRVLVSSTWEGTCTTTSSGWTSFCPDWSTESCPIRRKRRGWTHQWPLGIQPWWKGKKLQLVVSLSSSSSLFSFEPTATIVFQFYQTDSVCCYCHTHTGLAWSHETTIPRSTLASSLPFLFLHSYIWHWDGGTISLWWWNWSQTALAVTLGKTEKTRWPRGDLSQRNMAATVWWRVPWVDWGLWCGQLCSLHLDSYFPSPAKNLGKTQGLAHGSGLPSILQLHSMWSVGDRREQTLLGWQRA